MHRIFQVFHAPIFHTESPTLLGIGWGILATWWVGRFFGVLILAARAGNRLPLRASEVLPSIARLLAVMAVVALLSGITAVAWWTCAYGMKLESHGGGLKMLCIHIIRNMHVSV